MSKSLRQPTQVHLSFSPCQIPFYNYISKATEVNGCLLFHQNIPFSTLNCLYIRESYKTIASSIPAAAGYRIDSIYALATVVHKAIITGTPGIGKTLFMIYFLWKLVKEGKRVLFIYHPFNIYYDSQGNVFQFSSGRLPSDIDYSFWNADLWCLFDTKSKQVENLYALPFELCSFVLSTAPRREMINDFKKPPPPQIFYMPLWTEAELEIIAPSFLDAIDWKERFRILGGIPRHVLEVTTEDPTELLTATCQECNLNDCIKIISLNSTITEKSKVAHFLVHITSKDPFTESSVSYASETALNIIVADKGTHAKLKMAELLAEYEGNPLTASLCGYIFEPYALELLEKGGKFDCRKLVHGNAKKKPAKAHVIIPPSTRTVVDKVEPNQTKNQLYIPKTKNSTAIDAWIPGFGAFQMTVGKTHDIKGGAKDDLALLGTNKLYWLLPPLYFETFTKKDPQEIEQYAVRIPYPSIDE